MAAQRCKAVFRRDVKIGPYLPSEMERFVALRHEKRMFKQNVTTIYGEHIWRPAAIADIDMLHDTTTPP
jgi:hypothetical protein